MAFLAMVAPTMKTSGRVGGDRARGLLKRRLHGKLFPPLSSTGYQGPPSWTVSAGKLRGGGGGDGNSARSPPAGRSDMSGDSPRRSHRKPWPAFLCGLIFCFSAYASMRKQWRGWGAPMWHRGTRSQSGNSGASLVSQQREQIDGDDCAMASLAMVAPTTKMRRSVGGGRSSTGAPQAAAAQQALPAAALTGYEGPPSWQSPQANSAGAEAAMGTLHALLRWAGATTSGSP
uniref:Uncharacterized protein n=1 Tax=Oryza nivara TaxID=4536 RepID=A0A0E0IIG7_ORYNI